jgi:putative peptidoglycan lipid II flippase
MTAHLGKGKLTLLTYGILIPDGLFGVISFALGSVILSYFSKWIVMGEKRLVVDATQRAILWLTYLLLPIIFLFSLNAEFMIGFVFERGLFSHADTALVSYILSFYIFSVYILLLVAIASRIVTASGHFRYYMKVGAIIFMLKVGLNILLVEYFDYLAMPASSMITFLFNAFVIYIYLDRVGYRVFNLSFMKEVLKCFILLSLVLVSLFIAHLSFQYLTPDLRFILEMAILISVMGLGLRINQRINILRFKGIIFPKDLSA